MRYVKESERRIRFSVRIPQWMLDAVKSYGEVTEFVEEAIAERLSYYETKEKRNE